MPDSPPKGPFGRAILALNGGPTDPLVIKLGAEFARSWKTELVVVHVVEVDWSHDLDEDLASSSEAASAILDLAEGQAERRGTTVRTDLLQARDVGAAIVDEAGEMDADVIVLGLPYRKKFGGDFAMGRTVPYVLQNAPCAVLVVREPIPAETAAASRQPEAAMGVGIGPADRL